METDVAGLKLTAPGCPLVAGCRRQRTLVTPDTSTNAQKDLRSAPRVFVLAGQTVITGAGQIASSVNNAS